MKQEHIDQINEAVRAVASKERINHFYFVACGGSQAFLMPGQYLFDREIEIPSSVYSSNEFVHRAPKALGPDSVVITCSHSGNTPETVKAAEVSREKGATTIALSNLVDSPLWKASEYCLHYDWRDADESDKNKGILYRLLFSVLNTIQPCEKYQKGIDAVDHLNGVIEDAKTKYADRLKEWGSKYKRETLIYTMASGASYGEAYSFTSCLLMEMQWIHSSAIHSGEYFHGPFEITDFDVPFIIIKGVGATRPLDDRAYAFCKKYSNEIMLVDEAEFDMTGIDEEVQEYFAPLLAGAVLRSLADEFAYQRGHDLGVRRYMWRMEY
ncbi:SIS domain-containing protein [Blautia liquoris]|jgi:fructoselysine 6-phosphate deglycase|uniref:SIS domain-containing protein n=1 Tax=Blautia liquoris TaxID=2779518 RepID=A0A7M2RIF0_9FIRM|nr:SIS domain-containing protein [Blautia liquoris]QOV19132.1 SIS domain-containing protein [Blautia liquoris]